ncbi:MAG: hypothetical protein IKO41_04115 [Lachnospiraceae bacterium]|nr:hypothetical protein [Lachnospiraceae bacterium]
MYFSTDVDQDFFDGLRESLPPVFTRKFASQITGGLFSAKALSNLDSAGKGPSKKAMCGKAILYEKENFIEWLSSTVRDKKNIQRPARHDNAEIDYELYRQQANTPTINYGWR